MSWGELLGGGKDGFQKMKVIMAPPNPDSPNQNRQLRLSFGEQDALAQPGEVPLKIVSINPVEGYDMGPLAQLQLQSGTTDTQESASSEPVHIQAKAAYGSDPTALSGYNQIISSPVSNQTNMPRPNNNYSYPYPSGKTEWYQ